MNNLTAKKTTCATCSQPIESARNRVYRLRSETLTAWPLSDGLPRHREGKCPK